MSEREARAGGLEGPAACPCRSRPRRCARASPSSARCSACRRASINERVVQQLAVDAVREHPRARRRAADDAQLPARAPRATSRASPSSRSTCAATREGSTAAQLVGTIGEINPDELGTERYRGVVQGTVVGKEGIERTYDSYLRGDPGVQSITIDAAGPAQEPARRARRRGPATSCARRSTSSSSRPASARWRSMIRGGPGTAGAFVALDPRNGEVLATGSYPTFRPSVLSKPISQQRYDSIFGERGRLAEVQPRDLRRLPDGLDVQADHRAGGARQGPDHAGHADQRPGRR